MSTTSEPTQARTPKNTERRLLSFDLTAQWFQVHVATIERWAQKGYFPIYSSGKTYYADIDEVEAAMQQLGPNRMRDGRRPRWSKDADVRPLRAEDLR